MVLTGCVAVAILKVVQPYHLTFHARPMIKRAPSLTEQVKAYIKDRIVNDEFPDGRIPAELEMAEALGVSRTTVRDALSRLEMEGVVVRKQGSGTFVNKPMLQIHTRLDEIWSYEAILRAHGFTPSTQVLECRIVHSGATGFGDTFGELLSGDLLLVRKLFLEDDRPVILTTNYLAQQLINRPYPEEDVALPVYEFLELFGSSQLSYYLTEIVPQTASPDVAEALAIAPGTPLIVFDETGYDEANQPILRALSYFRDDLLRLRIMRRRTQDDWSKTHG